MERSSIRTNAAKTDGIWLVLLCVPRHCQELYYVVLRPCPVSAGWWRGVTGVSNWAELEVRSGLVIGMTLELFTLAGMPRRHCHQTPNQRKLDGPVFFW